MSTPAWSTSLPWDLIRSTAAACLDPNLVAAIIQHESLGNPWKTRYEPTYHYLTQVSAWASKTGVSQATELIQQQTSWGLMQLMGGVLRELGFDGLMPEACQPEVNLSFGCRKLRSLWERYETESEVISAYNLGSAIKTPGGLFLNQKTYVDPVCALLRELRAVD